MAEADWTDFTNGLPAADVRKGVTLAFTPPDSAAPISGSFTWFFNTLTTTVGIAARFIAAGVDGGAFTPTSGGKGGSIRACIRRYNGQSGYYPFIALVDSNDVAGATPAKGYILGLTNSGSTAKLMLRKGVLNADMPDDASNLRVSTGTYGTDWVDIRLDLILNPQGDVVLNVYENDLDAHQPDNPTWVAVPGMDQFVDDSGGILTGSVPTTGEYYFAYGIYNAGQASRAALFDFIEAARQTTP